MNKPNYQEWKVEFKEQTIRVSNWWNWEMKGSADLYLDDEHLDKNTDMLANPNKVLLSKYEVSEDINRFSQFRLKNFLFVKNVKKNGRFLTTRASGATGM